MAMTLQQLQDAINSGDYVNVGGVAGKGLSGLGGDSWAYYPKNDPQGLGTGYWVTGPTSTNTTIGYPSEGGGGSPYSTTTSLSGPITAFKEAAPAYGTKESPGWRQNFNWNDGNALKAALGIGGLAFGLSGGLGGLLGSGGMSTADALASTGLNLGTEGFGSTALGAGTAGTGASNMGWDWLNADGSLNLENLAAQDYADFGTPGVQALGNSLGYSQGVDWMPGMTGSGGMLSTLQNYITSNPGSTIQTAAKALGLTNADGSTNWGRILGGVGSAALGMYGANQSANAMERISDKYSAMGAPYRAQLASLYSDPGSFLKSDQVQQPVQQGTNALARALSVNGNPTGSGTALQEMQDYATNSLWSKLGEEKSRLGALGGLSSMPANVGQATDTAAAQSTGQGLNALGYGLNSVLNPQPNTNQLLQQLFKNSLA